MWNWLGELQFLDHKCFQVMWQGDERGGWIKV